MKTVINISEINLALEEYRDAYAKIWSFNVSLKRLFIRLFLKDHDEVVYLLSVSSEHISGPFSWHNANLYIQEDINKDSSEPIYKLIDKDAGFQLVSSGGIVLARGLEEDFGSSFWI